LAHTQGLKAHIRVDMLVSLFSPRARLICEVITYFLGVTLFALITWQSLASAIQAWKIGETTFGLILFPLFPAKVLVPIGSLIFCLRLILDFFHGLKKLRKKEYP